MILFDWWNMMGVGSLASLLSGLWMSSVIVILSRKNYLYKAGIYIGINFAGLRDSDDLSLKFLAVLVAESLVIAICLIFIPLVIPKMLGFGDLIRNGFYSWITGSIIGAVVTYFVINYIVKNRLK